MRIIDMRLCAHFDQILTILILLNTDELFFVFNVMSKNLFSIFPNMVFVGFLESSWISDVFPDLKLASSLFAIFECPNNFVLIEIQNTRVINSEVILCESLSKLNAMAFEFFISILIYSHFACYDVISELIVLATSFN